MDVVDEFISQYCEEINEAEVDQIFAKYDNNGNGLMELCELHKFLQGILYNQLSVEKLDTLRIGIVKRLDDSKNQRVSREELKCVLPTKTNFLRQFQDKKKICQVDFSKVWNHYDIDGRGALEEAELMLFLKDLLGLIMKPGERLQEEKLKVILLDKENTISKEALMRMLGVACDAAFQENSHECSQVYFNTTFAKYDKENNDSIDERDVVDLFRELLELQNTDIPNEDIKDFINTVIRPSLGVGTDKIQKVKLQACLNISTVA